MNFLKGYVEIELGGPDRETQINRLNRSGVSLRNLKAAEACFRARVDLVDYLKIRREAGKGDGSIRKISQRGAPFIAGRFRKRYIFLICMLLSVMVVYGLSLRIWRIEVSGNDTVSGDTIIKVLDGMGIGMGTRVSQIDFDLLKDRVLVEIDDLSWFAMNVRGSTALVEVRERVRTPVVIDGSIPCNVVAAKAGIITKIHVLEGSRQVSTGDSVVEGQLIASGVVDTVTGMRLVHAMALVQAQTRIEIEAKMPLAVQERVHTGESETKYALIMGGRRINLYFSGSISYDMYDTIISSNQLVLPGGLALPIYLTAEENREYREKPDLLNVDRCAEALEEALLNRMDGILGEGELISADFETAVDGSVVTVTLVAECSEEIAKTAMIPIWKELGG